MLTQELLEVISKTEDYNITLEFDETLNLFYGENYEFLGNLDKEVEKITQSILTLPKPVLFKQNITLEGYNFIVDFEEFPHIKIETPNQTAIKYFRDNFKNIPEWVNQTL
jgi:hypothetical protein